MEQQGIKILIEPSAFMHVLGTKMDFVEDPIKWVRPGGWARAMQGHAGREARPRSHGRAMSRSLRATVQQVKQERCAAQYATHELGRHAVRRSEFVFVNPNAKGQCGCGESFTT